MMTYTDPTGPRIYVASLSDYNAGILHGVWIDAAQDADDIRAEVEETLKASPTARGECYYCGRSKEIHDSGREPHAFVPSVAEEWAIHDYEGFGSLKLSEWESFERVSEIASLIEDHGDAWIAYADNVGLECADEDSFLDAYCGEWVSEADYAYDLAHQCNWTTSVSSEDLAMQWPLSCIDWERAWNELRMGGDNYSIQAGAPDYGYYIFRGE